MCIRYPINHAGDVHWRLRDAECPLVRSARKGGPLPVVCHDDRWLGVGARRHVGLQAKEAKEAVVLLDF